MAANIKYLARSNKSCMRAEATKRRRSAFTPEFSRRNDMLAIARELTGTLLADWRRWGKLFPLVLAANVVIATSAWVLVDLLMK
jgi:hypothetical protein